MKNKYQTEKEGMSRRGLIQSIGGLAGAAILAGCGPAAGLVNAISKRPATLPTSGVGHTLIYLGQAAPEAWGETHYEGGLDSTIVIDQDPEKLPPAWRDYVMAHELWHAAGNNYHTSEGGACISDDNGIRGLDRPPCPEELERMKYLQEVTIYTSVASEELIEPTARAVGFWNSHIGREMFIQA